MAQLHSIIGSILRDIISAQHEANLYSYSLSEAYGKEGKVRDFQLPSVAISDMELELKYGVLSSEAKAEEYNIRYGKLRQFMHELCKNCSKIAIRTGTEQLLRRNASKEISLSREYRSFFENLSEDEKSYNELMTYQTRAMVSSFAGVLYEIIDSETGTLKKDAILDRLMSVVNKKMLYDADMSEVFEVEGGNQQRTEIADCIRKALGSFIEVEIKDENFKRTKSFPQLDVAVTSDELSKMPEEAIHSFKLKFTPTTGTIVPSDDDDAIDDDFIAK